MPDATISDLYERRAEYDNIVTTVVTQRRNLLVHGEDRSGKTRLLQQFAAAHPNAAYISLAPSIRDVLLQLLNTTSTTPQRATPIDKTSSIPSLTNQLEARLSRESRILVLDRVDRPSANVTKLIKSLHDYGRTPILFASRSFHMEDIGNFRTFCYDKSSRLELKPWPTALALDFARHHAALLQLSAPNLDESLKGIAELSAGHPGRIVDMLGMATRSKYLTNDGIKFRSLYLDYIMSLPSSPSKL